MVWKDEFLKVFNEQLKLYGTNLDNIINNDKLDEKAKQVLEKPIMIITGSIGARFGLKTREDTLAKKIVDETEITCLMNAFKKYHKEKFGINVAYGQGANPKELYIEVNGCMFENNCLPKRCDYSINWLKSYFGAESVNKLESNGLCFFSLTFKNPIE